MRPQVVIRTVSVVLLAGLGFVIHGQTQPPTPSARRVVATKPDPKLVKRASSRPIWPGSNPGQDTTPETNARVKNLHEKALAHLSERRVKEALAALKEAESLDPKSFAIRMTLGDVYRMLSDRDNAARAFQKAVELRPSSATASANYCDALARAQRPVEAVVACREAVRLSPNDLRYHVLLGNAYSAAGSYEQAITLLEQLRTRSQNDLFVLGNLGDVYFDAGDYRAAAGVYREISLKWPTVAQTYFRLSLVYDYLGEVQPAIASARKAVELMPEFYPAHHNLGEVLQNNGFYEEAIEPLKRAIELAPDLGEAYDALSQSYEILGDEENTLAALRKAYQYSPATASLSYRYGGVLAAFGYHKEAIEPLERANQLRPDHPDILLSLGLAYLESGQRDKGSEMIEASKRIRPFPPNIQINIPAAKDVQRYLESFDAIAERVKKQPNDMGARRDLVTLYEYKGMLKEAEQHNVEWARQVGTAEAYNELGIFYFKLREFDKGITAIRKAIELKRHHVLYLTLSFYLKRMGKLDEAIDAAKEAVAIKPDSVETRRDLGDLLLKKGDRPGALAQFQAAFDVASGDLRPNFRLAWLYIRMGNKEGAFRHYAILKGIAPPGTLDYLTKSIRAHFGGLPE
jgi:tetratricopeptide (TPR) repeat protein